MSQEQDTNALDLIRWTFHASAEHRDEIEGYLADQGFDVLVQDEATFIVTWEEPDRDVDEVIEAIWDLNEEPFEVTQETFKRLEMHTLVHSDDEPESSAA